MKTRVKLLDNDLEISLRKERKWYPKKSKFKRGVRMRMMKVMSMRWINPYSPAALK